MTEVTASRSPTCSPFVSIVIPIYNEEAILHAAVVDLRERLRPVAWDYEVVLAENGSHDQTVRIAERLCDQYPEVSVISIDRPNYGAALRQGILAARGTYVLCDEIDLCDVAFQRRAVSLMESGTANLVIGSKLIGGASDERPFLRHAASVTYTSLLRSMFGFRGTDTHGLKAFRRAALLDVVRTCIVDQDVFASELVIRAYRAGVEVIEVPVRVKEKRPPSINLLNRVPGVLSNLARLTWAIRLKG